MAILSPPLTPEPVRHDLVAPDCYGCTSSHACSEACSLCACRWTTDASGDPNTITDVCDDANCECHTIAFADTRAMTAAEDGMEAAWREAGYRDSFAVYQAESR